MKKQIIEKKVKENGYCPLDVFECINEAIEFLNRYPFNTNTGPAINWAYNNKRRNLNIDPMRFYARDVMVMVPLYIVIVTLDLEHLFVSYVIKKIMQENCHG